MNKIGFILLFLALAFTENLHAQLADCSTFNGKEGMITINSDPRLDTLVAQDTRYNKKDKQSTYDGFRIQVYFGTKREIVNEIKSEFIKEFEDVPIYLIYESPYFKLRAGDFRNRIEAQNLYYRIHENFKSAFIVKDDINFPELPQGS